MKSISPPPYRRDHHETKTPSSALCHRSLSEPEVISFLLSMLTTLVFSLMLAAQEADTDPEFRQVSVYDGLVEIEVPAHWENIPPELLESHSLRMAESTGGRVTEVYQHGFRTSDPEVDFVLPECLIQIRESGRLRFGPFLRLPSVEDMHSEGEGALVDHTGIAARRMELSDAFFDREAYSLHLRNTLDLSYESEIIVESVAFLTERGFFTIHFYVRASQIDDMAPIYTRIIDSVRFDDKLRYQPRLSDRLPSRTPLILLVSAFVIAIGGIAVHLIQRRRKQP
jgi:hypothetical protein